MIIDKLTKEILSDLSVTDYVNYKSLNDQHFLIELNKRNMLLRNMKNSTIDERNAEYYNKFPSALSDTSQENVDMFQACLDN